MANKNIDRWGSSKYWGLAKAQAGDYSEGTSRVFGSDFQPYELNTAAVKGSAVDPTEDPVAGDGLNTANWIDLTKDSSSYRVDNISDLLTNPEANTPVIVAQYHVNYAQGEGIYAWDATKDKAEHNGGSIIDPAQTFPADWTDQAQVTSWFTAGVGAGCWVRSSVGTPEAFGAYGNGDVGNVVADNAALQAHIDASVIVAEYRSHAGYFTSSDGIEITKSLFLEGNYCSITQTATNSKIFFSDGVNDITYRNIELKGYGVNDTPNNINAESFTATAKAIGIEFRNGTGITCEKVRVSDCKNAGILTAYSSDVFIDNCHVTGTHPDPDIPLNVTSRQQFGIIIYAQSSFVEGTAQALKSDGTGPRHNNNNIKISNCRVADTAIAYMVFPGYRNIIIENNETYGTLTQHSAYVYAYFDTYVRNNVFTPDAQASGVKISNNVGAVRKKAENTQVVGNTIKNASFNGITFEIFEYVLANTTHVAKGSSWFEKSLIRDNHIESYSQNAIVVACTKGEIRNNTMINGTSNATGAIDLRSFSGVIKDNSIDGVCYSAIEGSPALVDEIVFDRNIIDNPMCPGSASLIAFSMAVPEEPIELEVGRWISEGSYCSVGGSVYLVLQTGVPTSLPISTDGSDETVGTVIVKYIDLYANLNATISLLNNEIRDTRGESVGTGAFSIQHTKCDLRLYNNRVDRKFKNNNRIRCTIHQREKNNWYNSDHTFATYSSNMFGRNGNTYTSDTYPPAYTTDFYEVGDTYLPTVPTAQDRGLLCIKTGRSGQAVASGGADWVDIGQPAIDSGYSIELTIATGAITIPAESAHPNLLRQVDTEVHAITDDLDVINGGISGQTLTLRPQSPGRDIVLIHSANLMLFGDTNFTLANHNDRVTLECVTPGNWISIQQVTH